MISRRRRNSLLYSPLTAALLMILVVLLGRGVWGVVEKEQEARRQLEAAAAEQSALQERETYLQSEIKRLSTPRGVEEELREKFGVAKEGEEVIVVVSPPQNENSSSAEKNLWQEFFDWF